MLTLRPFDDLWLGPGTNDALRKLIDTGAYSSTKNKHRLEYRMDVNEERLRLVIDVPGVKSDDITVDHLDGYLTVKTTRDDVVKSLSLRVADDFDVEGCTADLELGVLTIDMPRKPKPAPTKIRVNARE